MILLLIIVVMALMFFILLAIDLTRNPPPKPPYVVASERRMAEREARINRAKITAEEIEESHRLMQTEFFKEISSKLYNNVSESILNAARELKFFPDFRWYDEFIGMRDDELSYPFTRWLNVDLSEMGYKPIREVKQARIFMYSLGRITGFKFSSYPDHSKDGYNIWIKIDYDYWKEIYDKEYKKASDKKYNDNYKDLKDIFE